MNHWKQVAAIDIGSPKNHQKKIGWFIDSAHSIKYGHSLDGVDGFIDSLTIALQNENEPLALGFEAPMFVPVRENVEELTKAREGEIRKNFKNRPFSAGAGASVLVTGMVVALYILRKLRKSFPDVEPTLNWCDKPTKTKRLLLFEAFVSEQQPSKNSDPHIQDARTAVEAFQGIVTGKYKTKQAKSDTEFLSLLGAILLQADWSKDPGIIRTPCLIAFARGGRKWGLESKITRPR